MKISVAMSTTLALQVFALIKIERKVKSAKSPTPSRLSLVTETAIRRTRSQSQCTAHRLDIARLEDDELEDIVLDIPATRGVLGKQESLGVAQWSLAIVNLSHSG